MDLMWLCKITYAGSGYTFWSTTEPEWKAVKGKDGEKRYRLIWTPWEEATTYRDKPTMPIYRDQLVQFAVEHRGPGARSTNAGDKSRVNNDLRLVLKAIEEGRDTEEGDPSDNGLASYSDIRTRTGISQMRIKVALDRSQKKGYHTYEKVGRRSEFSLTEKGFDFLDKEAEE